MLNSHPSLSKNNVLTHPRPRLPGHCPPPRPNNSPRYLPTHTTTARPRQHPHVQGPRQSKRNVLPWGCSLSRLAGPGEQALFEDGHMNFALWLFWRLVLSLADLSGRVHSVVQWVTYCSGMNATRIVRALVSELVLDKDLE